MLTFKSLKKHLKQCDYNICTNCGSKMAETQERNCEQNFKLRLTLTDSKVTVLKNINHYLEKANQRLSHELQTLRQNLWKRFVSLRLWFKQKSFDSKNVWVLFW